MSGTTQSKSKFTADEKAKMITLAWIAGAYVSVADQAGGPKEEAKESQALREAIARAFTVYQTQTGENLSGEPAAFDFDKAPSELESAWSGVSATLEAKDSTENMDHYKAALLHVGHSVAAAHGAGFLGRGEAVSAAETAAIEKLATTIKGTHLLEAARSFFAKKK